MLYNCYKIQKSVIFYFNLQDNEKTHRTYRGSSGAAFCHGKHPVKHTNKTIPNCQTSCDGSALQKNNVVIFLLTEEEEGFFVLLVWFVCINDEHLWRTVWQPFVAALYQAAVFPWLAKVTELDTRKVRSTHQHIIQFHVSMDDVSAKRMLNIIRGNVREQQQHAR